MLFLILKEVLHIEGIAVKGEWDFIYSDLQGNEIERITKTNIITQTGLDFIASLLINQYTNDIPFYLAMGKGTEEATRQDTQLEDEQFRKIIASQNRQGSMIRLRFFLLQNEANGDWEEYGIFAAGTENEGSGEMINRLVTPVSKANNTVLTVEVRITLSGGD